MKVVCVEKFEGILLEGGTTNSPLPVVDCVYTVVRTETNISGFAGHILLGFGQFLRYDVRKFRPITTEDFRWESIDEVLQNVTSEVHNG